MSEEKQQLATTAAPAQAPARQAPIIAYTPIGQTTEIKISRDILINNCISPTKSGRLPSDNDMTAFIALCKAQKLNPFTKDCYLLGYDNADGTANFSIITAKASLDKRAESNEEFDGYESGLVFETEEGNLEYRDGAICRDQEAPRVCGAWCKVYRKDRSRPVHHEVNRSAYDSGKSRWKVDLAGMITKCAEAGALRKAFPNLFAGMYIEEEMAPEKITVDASSSSSPSPAAEFQSSLPPRQLPSGASTQPNTDRTAKPAAAAQPEPEAAQAPTKAPSKKPGPDPRLLPELPKKTQAMVEALGAAGIPEGSVISTLNAVGVMVDNLSELTPKEVDHIMSDITVLQNSYEEEKDA